MFANIKKIAVYLHTEFSGCSTVRLARHVRDVEVGSSNLLTPTSKVPEKRGIHRGYLFLFWCYSSLGAGRRRKETVLTGRGVRRRRGNSWRDGWTCGRDVLLRNRILLQWRDIVICRYGILCGKLFCLYVVPGILSVDILEVNAVRGVPVLSKISIFVSVTQTIA